MTGADLAGVGVVLVEFHSGGLVAARAVEAVEAGCRVVVADNVGGYDGPGTVVATGGNIGFGSACNRAVAALEPDIDVVVLQNPDATIAPDALAALVSAVRGGWAAVAPSLMTAKVRPFGFSAPRPLREVLVSAREVARARRGPVATRRPVDYAPLASSSGPVGSAVVQRRGRFGTAALLALDRQAFEALGGFDDDYFLYVEDLDLWRRLEQADHRVGFLPGAIAVHDEAGGSVASVARRTALRFAGRDLFAVRHQRTWWRWYRLLHRIAVLGLPKGDAMVEAVRRGYRAGRDPAKTLDDVRSIALGREAVPAVERIRVGWSRTAVPVAAHELVLDVGSGAFPNARADVLCERAPLRPHRAAVVDRPFVVADALALPFRNGAFGFVIASHLAEHVDAPEVFCAELARVARSGYVETPSPVFERLFPEANHQWRVRSRGPGVLQFERNHFGDDPLAQLGRRLYRWYYAGQDKGLPSISASGLLGTLVARVAYVTRGVANRLGLTVTRLHFGPSAPLRGELDRKAGPVR